MKKLFLTTLLFLSISATAQEPIRCKSMTRAPSPHQPERSQGQHLGHHHVVLPAQKADRNARESPSPAPHTAGSIPAKLVKCFTSFFFNISKRSPTSRIPLISPNPDGITLKNMWNRPETMRLALFISVLKDL